MAWTRTYFVYVIAILQGNLQANLQATRTKKPAIAGFSYAMIGVSLPFSVVALLLSVSIVLLFDGVGPPL